VRSDFIREVGEVFEGHLTGYRDFQDAIRKATWAKTSRFENLMTLGEQVEVAAFSCCSRTLRNVEICNWEITTVQFFCSSKCSWKYLVMWVLGAWSLGREMDRGSKLPDSMVSDHFLRNRETSAASSLWPTLTDLSADMFLRVMSNILRNIEKFFGDLGTDKIPWL